MDGVDSYYEFILPLNPQRINTSTEIMKQGTKMSISHFIFLFHVFSLSISPSLCLSGVGTAAGYINTIHHCIIYHKIIDSKEGVELYCIHFTRLDTEKSHPACSENMKTYINNKRYQCF